MLVELGLMEQRHKAVLEVLGGLPVMEVARRYGVARQTVHDWLRRYATEGFAALFDHSRRPATCPHQMRPQVEARIVALRRAHSGWGPLMLRHQLEQEHIDSVPSLSSIYRCLSRHGLIDPQKRRRRREDYQRWERNHAMELWQMDIMAGVKLTDESDLKIITGLDDHSRFCVSALLVPRATARPVCEALALALKRYGVPDQILTACYESFVNSPSLAIGPLGVQSSGKYGMVLRRTSHRASSGLMCPRERGWPGVRGPQTLDLLLLTLAC
jgi:transposase